MREWELEKYKNNFPEGILREGTGKRSKKGRIKRIKER